MLRRAYYIARCISALNSDQVSLGRRYFDRVGERHRRHPRLIALGARISLLENDTPAAVRQLRDALSKSNDGESARIRYIEQYCQYFLNLIDRTGDHERHREEALRLNSDRRLQVTLPLPQGEIALEEVERLNRSFNKTLH